MLESALYNGGPNTPVKRIVKWVLLLAVCVGVAGLLYRAGAQQATNVKPTVSANERYRIVINNNVRADTFLLDTATGKTWVQTSITDLRGGPTVWMYREHIDDVQGYAAWLRGQKLKQ